MCMVHRYKPTFTACAHKRTLRQLSRVFLQRKSAGNVIDGVIDVNVMDGVIDVNVIDGVIDVNVKDGD